MAVAEVKYSRKFPRRRFKHDVALIHRGKFSLVAGVEIGEGGMLVKFPETVKAGSVVVISFFIPQKGFVSVIGEAVYQKADMTLATATDSGAVLGVKFMDLEFESKRRIRDFIALKTAQEALEETQK